MKDRLVLDLPDANGVTYRETLMRVQRQSGISRAADLKCAPIPTAGKRVWDVFFTVNKTRQSNGFGPCPISLCEIEAYCRLSGEILNQWEILAFIELDGTFLSAVAEQTAKDAS